MTVSRRGFIAGLLASAAVGPLAVSASPGMTELSMPVLSGGSGAVRFVVHENCEPLIVSTGGVGARAAAAV